jgi:hypothetical protein
MALVREIPKTVAFDEAAHHLLAGRDAFGIRATPEARRTSFSSASRLSVVIGLATLLMILPFGLGLRSWHNFSGSAGPRPNGGLLGAGERTPRGQRA